MHEKTTEYKAENRPTDKNIGVFHLLSQVLVTENKISAIITVQKKEQKNLLLRKLKK